MDQNEPFSLMSVNSVAIAILQTSSPEIRNHRTSNITYFHRCTSMIFFMFVVCEMSDEVYSVSFNFSCLLLCLR